MNVQAQFSQYCLGQAPNVNLTAKSFVAKLSSHANMIYFRKVQARLRGKVERVWKNPSQVAYKRKEETSILNIRLVGGKANSVLVKELAN